VYYRRCRLTIFRIKLSKEQHCEYNSPPSLWLLILSLCILSLILLLSSLFPCFILLPSQIPRSRQIRRSSSFLDTCRCAWYHHRCPEALSISSSGPTEPTRLLPPFYHCHPQSHSQSTCTSQAYQRMKIAQSQSLESHVRYGLWTVGSDMGSL
jgi:hypothetical protein